MSKMMQYSLRKFQKILSNNGYTLERKNGDHYIYKNNLKTIVINKNPNPCVMRRLIKENNLKVGNGHKRRRK